MCRFNFFFIICFLSVFLFTCNTDKKFKNGFESVILKEKSDSLSYYLGIVWQNSITQELKINSPKPNALMKGFRDFDENQKQLPSLPAIKKFIGEYITKNRNKVYEFETSENSNTNEESDIILKTKQDTFYYFLGIKFYNDIHKYDEKLKLNYKATLKGWNENYNNPLQGEELQEVNNYLFSHINSVLQIKNNEFLIKNKNKEGVVVLPSGLQYKILIKGFGKKPTENDKVKIHYTGRLINGEIFGSSIQKGEPSSLALTDAIKGWKEALQLMPIGSKWEIYIPYYLAYGPYGNGRIPGYSTLIIEVELLDIVK